MLPHVMLKQVFTLSHDFWNQSKTTTDSLRGIYSQILQKSAQEPLVCRFMFVQTINGGLQVLHRKLLFLIATRIRTIKLVIYAGG